MARTFPDPDPDPLLGLVDRDAIPISFWELGPHERRRRLRLYLISRNALGPTCKTCWMLAMAADEPTMSGIVDKWSDEDIVNDTNAAMARWTGFYAAQAAGELDEEEG